MKIEHHPAPAHRSRPRSSAIPRAVPDPADRADRGTASARCAGIRGRHPRDPSCAAASALQTAASGVQQTQLPAHLRRASMACQILSAMFTPSKRSSSWMPVGEVRLISVSYSPITSIPTKIWPFSLSRGRSRRRSRGHARSGRPFPGRPPTCMFERTSPAAGTRLIAPTASPSTRITRLSPLLTAGRYFCTISGSRLNPVKSSWSDEQVAVVLVQPEHPRAAIAVERLEDDVAMPRLEIADGRRSRAIVVGGVSSRKVQHHQLFGIVAHPERIVHHQCAGLRGGPADGSW